MARAGSWREVVLRVLHQVDEGFLEARTNLLPLVWWLAIQRDRLFERGSIIPADVQFIAEGDRLLHGGGLAQLVGEFEEIWAGYAPRRQIHVIDDFIDGAVCEQLAV